MVDVQFQTEMRDQFKSQTQLIMQMKDAINDLKTDIRVLTNDHQALKATYRKVSESLDALKLQSIRSETQIDAIQEHIKKNTKLGFFNGFLRYWQLWAVIIAGLSITFYRIGEWLLNLPPPG